LERGCTLLTVRLLLMCLLATNGCSFRVAGIDAPRGLHLDLAVRDGSIINQTIDLLTPTSDMPSVLLVSHVPQHFLDDGICDLAPSVSIVTSTPQLVDGHFVPSGCMYTTYMEGGTLDVAVLAVKTLTIAANVKVTGTRPLVVVASDSITITGTLDGGAKNTVPGPGGGVAGQGAGAGKDGTHAGTYNDSGGGGGGALAAGSKGGDTSLAGAVAVGGSGGALFTGNSVVTLPGGASGGRQSAEKCAAGIANGGAGAGGGSIQLSARNEIDISGNVDVGGGGGLGGCLNGMADQGSGAGGGSGGAVWLESPTVKLSGGAWANGGSGGSGAEGLLGSNGVPGGNGNDGTMSTIPAVGGASPGMYAGGGATGGTGTGSTASSGSAPGMPTPGMTFTANAGGGGGSAGTITIRYRGMASLSGNISPSPQLDPTVP
jgi:hypothetical protein